MAKTVNISPKVLAVVCAVAVEEGFFRADSLPFRNNNPGDLTKWGNHPIIGRFVRFQSIAEGFEDLADDIQINEDHNLTLRQFINKYAPPVENQTSSYLSFVSKFTGIGLDEVL